jgi:hypothetical protein
LLIALISAVERGDDVEANRLLNVASPAERGALAVSCRMLLGLLDAPE